MWMPILWTVGWVIKHKTAIPNSMISVIIYALALIRAGIYGYTVYLTQPMPLWEALAVYGLGQGSVLAFASVFLYDTAHGIIKARFGKHLKTNQEEGEVCMKERLKAAWLKVRYKSITAYLLGFVATIAVCAGYYLLSEGTQGIADFLTGNAIFTVASCVFIDIFLKVTRNPKRIVKQYWITVLSVLLADGILVWAFGRDTVKMQIIGLIATLVVTLAAIALSHWLYAPAVKKRDDEIEELAIRHLVERKIPHGVATDIVKNSWVGTEIEEKIIEHVTGEVK